MLQPEKSIFQFEDFVILRYSCNFINSEDQNIGLKVKSFTDQYELGVDFGFADKPDDNKVLLFCKVEVNRAEKKLPGYSIFVEGVGVFDKELGNGFSQERFVREIQFPAISHGINQLRNYIQMATAQGPYGRYHLPLINLVQLLKAKSNEMVASRAEEKNNKDK